MNFDTINIEIFNEHFYYGKENSSFISSYDTELDFDFDPSGHSYTLSHVCYHTESDKLDQFKSMYKPTDFNFDTIFEDGAGDEIYDGVGIDKIHVFDDSIEVTFETREVNQDEKDDYIGLL